MSSKKNNNTNLNDSFNERIAIVRATLKLSQKNFAMELKVSPQHINRYENRNIEPRSSFLSKLAKRFKVNLNWLLTGKGDMFILEAGETIHDKIKRIEQLEKRVDALKDMIAEDRVKYLKDGDKDLSTT